LSVLRSWQAAIALVLIVVAALAPLGNWGGSGSLFQVGGQVYGILFLMLLATAVAGFPERTSFSDGFIVFLGAHAGAWQALEVLPMVSGGGAGWGFWRCCCRRPPTSGLGSSRRSRS
jgi:hypothetical protein